MAQQHKLTVSGWMEDEVKTALLYSIRRGDWDVTGQCIHELEGDCRDLMTISLLQDHAVTSRSFLKQFIEEDNAVCLAQMLSAEHTSQYAMFLPDYSTNVTRDELTAVFDDVSVNNTHYDWVFGSKTLNVTRLICALKSEWCKALEMKESYRSEDRTTARRCLVICARLICMLFEQRVKLLNEHFCLPRRKHDKQRNLINGVLGLLYRWTKKVNKALAERIAVLDHLSYTNKLTRYSHTLIAMNVITAASFPSPPAPTHPYQSVIIDGPLDEMPAYAISMTTARGSTGKAVEGMNATDKRYSACKVRTLKDYTNELFFTTRKLQGEAINIWAEITECITNNSRRAFFKRVAGDFLCKVVKAPKRCVDDTVDYVPTPIKKQRV